MNFPIDITFQMLGWRASMLITDAAGAVIGFVPAKGHPKQQLRIFADEELATVLYRITEEHALTQWLEDGQGRRLGEFGPVPTASGKYVIIEGQRRFHFVEETPWRDLIDTLVPYIPVLNGLVRSISRTSHLGLTADGDRPVLRIERQRLMIDIRYTLHRLAAIEGRDLECLLLSSLVHCLWDHRRRLGRW
jgi:hypothetical protein